MCVNANKKLQSATLHSFYCIPDAFVLEATTQHHSCPAGSQVGQVCSMMVLQHTYSF
jgi:hypothetical protein